MLHHSWRKLLITIWTVIANSNLALDMPFLLLPFRPSSDPSAARNFVRNFFKSSYEGTRQFSGDGLQQELRLAEPLVRLNCLPIA